MIRHEYHETNDFYFVVVTIAEVVHPSLEIEDQITLGATYVSALQVVYHYPWERICP